MLDKQSVSIVLKRVSTRLFSKRRKIDGETYTRFFEVLANVLVGCDEQSEELDTLRHKILVYGSSASVRGLEGFDVGASWASMRLLEECERLRNESDERRSRSAMVKRHVRLLQIVDQNPGVTQKELAKKLSVSPSSLSQTLARLKPYGLLVVSHMGRNKHYDLTLQAQQLLRDMSVKQVEGNSTTDSYYIIFEATIHAGTVDVRGKRNQTHEWHCAVSQHIPVTHGNRSSSLGNPSEANTLSSGEFYASEARVVDSRPKLFAVC